MSVAFEKIEITNHSSSSFGIRIARQTSQFFCFFSKRPRRSPFPRKTIPTPLCLPPGIPSSSCSCYFPHLVLVSGTTYPLPRWNRSDIGEKADADRVDVHAGFPASHRCECLAAGPLGRCTVVVLPVEGRRHAPGDRPLWRWCLSWMMTLVLKCEQTRKKCDASHVHHQSNGATVAKKI